MRSSSSSSSINSVFLTRVCLLILMAVTVPGTTMAFAPLQRSASSLIQQKLSPNNKNLFLVVTASNKPSRPESSSSSSSTRLSMVAAAPPSVAIAAAITGALTAGFVSGGLHAMSGPDHLAALLPRCCGQPWYKAGRVGALWGMGHGFSATLIGVLAFGVKQSSRTLFNGYSKMALSRLSHITELAVGVSLILIGAMGMKEAREWKEEMETVQPQSLSAAAVTENGGIVGGFKTAQKRAVIFNGILHGFSWDGAPSLAPAIAVATWSGNLAFLSAYAIGTMSTMAIATTLIGEGTRRAGEVFQRPDIPQKLSYVSSILAIVIGAIWCGLALK